MFEYIILSEIAFFIVLTMILYRMFHQEREQKAAFKSLILGAIIVLILLVFFILKWETIYYIFLCADIFFVILLIIPYNPTTVSIDSFPKSRIDERDIMFSRKELNKGSKRYTDYYTKYPEKEPKDDLFRREPGLLSKESLYYDDYIFSEAENYFIEIEKLYPNIVQKPTGQTHSEEPHKLAQEIKILAKNLGAISIGFTKTADYHYYKTKGRREEYGLELKKEHSFAIAITVEMDYEMVSAAPKASIVMESARQYYQSGKIAIEIAKLLSSKGYEARAHIDGNYRIVCPLVARDAGLGEIGRMGLLMTPELGPRVRIAVITTNAILPDNKYKPEKSVFDFCSICKKCADCCPSNSISNNEPREINGVRRWQIDQESCFTYWCKVGTDCGRCMAVCPYSHPNNSLHKFIRMGIKNSRIFRYVALYMDDFFYGEKPIPKRLPNIKYLKTKEL